MIVLRFPPVTLPLKIRFLIVLPLAFVTAVDVAIGRMDRLNAFMRSFADVVRLPPPNLGPCDLKKVVDDILINFDDRRALATLEVLAEFSAKTQVLLFTHHTRIRDMAAALASPNGVFVQSLP